MSMSLRETAEFINLLRRTTLTATDVFDIENLYPMGVSEVSLHFVRSLTPLLLHIKILRRSERNEENQ